MIRRIGVATAVATLIAVTATSAADTNSSAASAEPAGATALEPATATSAYYQPLSFVNGSSGTYVVTSRFNPEGQDDPGLVAADDPVVDVRDSTGLVETLPNPTTLGEGWTYLSGSILVFAYYPNDAPSSSPFVIDWYDLANNTHGTTTSGAPVLAASPDGWITQSAAGSTPSDEIGLTDTATNGTTTDDGVPLPTETSTIDLDVTTGPDGILVDNGEDISGHTSVAYMPYAHPGTWTTLTTGAPAADAVICSDVIADAAACRYGTWNDDNEPVFQPAGVIRLPLDGSPAVSTADSCASDPVVDTTATVWATCPGVKGAAKIASMPAGGGSVSTVQASGAASEFRVLSLTSSQDTVFITSTSSPPTAPSTLSTTVDATAAPTVIASADKAPPSSTAPVLTPGRVAWEDDQTTKRPVWQRTATVTRGGAVDLGDEKFLDQPAFTQGLYAFALSGARGVFIPTKGSPSLAGPTGPSIFASASARITGLEPSALSGDRLAYQVATEHYRLYNIATGKTTAITGHGGGRIESISLWGNTLAYIERDGSVWRRDLATGKDTLLNPGFASRRPSQVSAFAYGEFVGWTLQYVPPRGVARYVSAYVNAVKAGAPTHVPAAAVIEQLTSNGVLTFDGTSGDWALTPYAGSTATTIATYPAAQDVTVDSSIIGYVNPTNSPMIAPLPTVVTLRPESLGDPVAPTSFTDRHRHRWTSYQPFSVALSSCKVTIRHHGTTVRRLTCNQADAALGDALVSWNGKNSKGKRVAAGRYTWHTTVATSAGSQLGPNGRSASLSGPIKVTR